MGVHIKMQEERLFSFAAMSCSIMLLPSHFCKQLTVRNILAAFILFPGSSILQGVTLCHFTHVQMCVKDIYYSENYWVTGHMGLGC